MKTLSLLLALLFCVSQVNAMVQQNGTGQFTIPTAPAAGTSCTSGAANTFTGTAVQLSASTSAIYITGVHVESAAALAATYIIVQLMIGAGGAETAIGQMLVPLTTGSTSALGFRHIYPPIAVAASSRLSVKTADSVGSKATLITVECILQSNVVTGVTEKADVDTIKTNPVVNGGTVTFPTSATLASTTNITAGTMTTTTNLTTNNDKTGYSLAASQHVIVDSGTVTTLSNLPSIPANWLTATGISASALNGKGDWLLASSYTAPPSAATIASATWQDTTAGDFTTSASVGKSVMNGVALGTGLTINAYTGNTVQTGDSYARIGAAGAGLTAIGDTRMADLDAAVSSRMATYSQPTGFLAATFPSGTIANTTNITAGTITTATTATNLTNLPSIPNNWLTAAGINASALNGKGDWNIGKTGYSLTQTFPVNFSLLSIDGSGDVTFNNALTDPWNVTLPASYTGQTAGHLLWKIGNKP